MKSESRRNAAEPRGLVDHLTLGLAIKNSTRALDLSRVWTPSRILYTIDRQNFSVTVFSSLVCLCDKNGVKMRPEGWEQP